MYRRFSLKYLKSRCFGYLSFYRHFFFNERVRCVRWHTVAVNTARNVCQEIFGHFKFEFRIFCAIYSKRQSTFTIIKQISVDRKVDDKCHHYATATGFIYLPTSAHILVFIATTMYDNFSACRPFNHNYSK